MLLLQTGVLSIETKLSREVEVKIFTLSGLNSEHQNIKQG